MCLIKWHDKFVYNEIKDDASNCAFIEDSKEIDNREYENIAKYERLFRNPFINFQYKITNDSP